MSRNRWNWYYLLTMENYQQQLCQYINDYTLNMKNDQEIQFKWRNKFRSTLKGNNWNNINNTSVAGDQ